MVSVVHPTDTVAASRWDAPVVLFLALVTVSVLPDIDPINICSLSTLIISPATSPLASATGTEVALELRAPSNVVV